METTIIGRLAKFLEDNGLSQTDLCLKLGISPQNFTTWKSGKREIPKDHILKIIELYPDLDGHWLLTGNEKPDKVYTYNHSKRL